MAAAAAVQVALSKAPSRDLRAPCPSSLEPEGPEELSQ